MVWSGDLHVYSLRACNLKKVFMIWKSFRLHNSTSWSPRSFRSPVRIFQLCRLSRPVPLWHSSRLSHTARLLSVSRPLHAVSSHRTLSISSSSAVVVGAYTCKTVMFTGLHGRRIVAILSRAGLNPITHLRMSSVHTNATPFRL